MRTDNMRESQNVEERRGNAPKMMVGGGLGIGGIVILLIYVLLGGNPQQLLQQTGQGGLPGGGPGAGGMVLPGGGGAGTRPIDPAQQEAANRVKRVLGDTEDVWRELFAAAGKRYEEPVLVLFSVQTDTACGMGDAATGPFYCPGDHKVYIDLAFYNELSSRFGAAGDFAQAYVVAHEIGHHVQNLLGISAKVDAARSRGASETQINDLSVRLELQADFLAGVWAHHANQKRHILDPGDIEEALNCATAIGDDRLQKAARGYAVPESFTHGTSEQRARWFKKGFETGDMSTGDTFAVPKP